MKVEVNKKEKSKEKEYPKLMCCDDLIVLFTEECEGVVIQCDESIDTTGEYRDDWIIDSFEPFEGSITLRND